MRNFSIFTSILIYFIALYFIIGSFNIEYKESRIFPQIIGIILIILTTIYLSNSIKKKEPIKGNTKRVLIVALLSILYVWFTPIFGYFITTPILIFLVMFYLGMRDIKVLILNPIISTSLIYIVFVKFFKIPVP